MASFVNIVSIPVQASRESLWFAVQLWISRPHVVNRRLCGIEPLQSLSVAEYVSRIDSPGIESWCHALTARLRTLELDDYLQRPDSHYGIELRTLIPRATVFSEVIEAVVTSEALSDALFLPLFPKTSLPNGVRSHTSDGDDGQAAAESEPHSDRQGSLHTAPGSVAPAVGLSEKPLSLQMSLEGDTAGRSCTADVSYRITCESLAQAPMGSGCVLNIDVALDQESSRSAASVAWLQSTLAPKLKSWAESPKSRQDLPSKESTSLKLLNVKRYSEVFNRLKEKYSKDLVTNWSETTDPQKFVSEDIGIAAYLLTLWEKERTQTGFAMQSFVDLGCGNGLLVHLLASEGHEGIGIDVRRRKIWDTFGTQTRLEERTFNPSTETLPQFDWIIGNHSDELTPWIPYVTARSGYNSRFFLLPCCAFDFNHKFNKSGNESEYAAFFKYLRHICSEMGFVLQEDILRIPSTKRKCFIGMQRTYKREEHEGREAGRVAFLKSRLQSGRGDFVVKAAIEPIRNCTNLPAEVKEYVIKAVAECLLQEENFIEVPAVRAWNAGRKLPLSTLIKVLDADVVAQMKNHFGGLQTFIRNHQFIFHIRNGEVQLRNYATDERPVKRIKKGATSKPRPCWFFANHPEGCPAGSGSCSYVHEASV